MGRRKIEIQPILVSPPLLLLSSSNSLLQHERNRAVTFLKVARLFLSHINADIFVAQEWSLQKGLRARRTLFG